MAASTPTVRTHASFYSIANSCLLLVVVAQWFLLLFALHNQLRDSSPSSTKCILTAPAKSTTTTTTQAEVKTPPISSQRTEGVAVTLMYRAPQWFHLRYTSMVQNALNNIPEDWKVQIFYNPEWFRTEILRWHPGIKRWFELGHDRILFTPLPGPVMKPEGQTQNVKPKQITSSRWFWENVVAEKVLVFSGNGAFCGNNFYNDGVKSGSVLVDMVDSVDFMGTPSYRNNRYGGDASSHSFRKRSLMLRVIDYAKAHNMKIGKESEDMWTLKVIEKMMQDNAQPPVILATPNQTQAFGGVHNLSDGNGVLHIPLVVAGTQARLSYSERDSLLKHCLEAKLIFPSLHEPACFGAHPNPQKCKESICALQDKIPGQGC